MGFNVIHEGGRSFITNSHCTNTQGGTEGTNYYQPTESADPISIATEAQDPQYFIGGPKCPVGKRCRYSDASRALYSSTTESTQGAIAMTTGSNNGDITVTGSFTIGNQDDSTTHFPIGAGLNKVGRTTGWTSGPVSRTCVNTNVADADIHLLCQTFVDADAGPGDSGSPVFMHDWDWGHVRLVGILWGTTSTSFVMSPLAQVRNELGPFSATDVQRFVTVTGTGHAPAQMGCYFEATTNIENPSFVWTVDGIEHSYDSYVTYASSSPYTLIVKVTNSMGHTATRDHFVNVSEWGDCNV
jgi:hypothetical protein